MRSPVGDAGNPQFVAAHARDIAVRSRSESDRLTSLMLRWAWPDGHSDRFDPAAAEWLARWSPVMVIPPLAGD